jgi:nucleotide-binding universal stress UspA family protein
MADESNSRAAAGPFATVVVPLDGSQAGEVVVPLAQAMARAADAALVFIRVVPYPEPPANAPSHGPARVADDALPDDVVVAEREARNYLERARQRFAAPEAEVVVAVGDPFNRIRAEAARRRRPVVVMTAKATAALPMSRDSALARRLVFAGLCPVMVVPPATA